MDLSPRPPANGVAGTAALGPQANMEGTAVQLQTERSEPRVVEPSTEEVAQPEPKGGPAAEATSDALCGGKVEVPQLGLQAGQRPETPAQPQSPGEGAHAIQAAPRVAATPQGGLEASDTPPGSESVDPVPTDASRQSPPPQGSAFLAEPADAEMTATPPHLMDPAGGPPDNDNKRSRIPSGSEDRETADRLARILNRRFAQGGRPPTADDVRTVLEVYDPGWNAKRVDVMQPGVERVQSTTFGKVGGQASRVSYQSRCYPEVARLCNHFLAAHWGGCSGGSSDLSKTPFTSLCFNKLLLARTHRDGNNKGPSIICSFGPFGPSAALGPF